MPICALLCARQCEACVRGMPPDEKGRPYNGEYCAACGQDCQSMVISQQNIAQQNSEIQDVLLSRSQERIIKTALDRVRANTLLRRAAPRQLRVVRRCGRGREATVDEAPLRVCRRSDLPYRRVDGQTLRLDLYQPEQEAPLAVPRPIAWNHQVCPKSPKDYPPLRS